MLEELESLHLSPRSRNDDDLDDEPLDDELDDEDLDEDELDDDVDDDDDDLDDDDDDLDADLDLVDWTTSTTTRTKFVRSRRGIRTATTTEWRVLYWFASKGFSGVNRG